MALDLREVLEYAELDFLKLPVDWGGGGGQDEPLDLVSVHRL